MPNNGDPARQVNRAGLPPGNNGAWDLDDLARRFAQFAATETKGTSPLYEALAARIAGDRDLLRLCRDVRPGQLPANMLFGAVHYLLQAGADHPLRAFYPSLVTSPLPPAGAFPAFRDFCLARADAIRAILHRRGVNTNEVARCAVLLPGFHRIAGQGGEPLHLVEIGCSAGLNLRWNAYAYDYGDGRRRGDSASPLIIGCELRGPRRPPLPDRLPAIGRRIGVDLAPLDPDAAADAAWLRALIWPEHKARAERLQAAIALSHARPVELRTGDGVALLPEIVRALPADGTVCVFHSFAVVQFAQDQRAAFEAALSDLGRRRLIFRLGLEWDPAAEEPRLYLHRYADEQVDVELLARCDAHGTWAEWLA